MYSANARDHFDCSPLLFSCSAPQNRCGQTEGGGVVLDYILRKLIRRINDECRKLPDQLFEVKYADGTALVTECMDRILELAGLSSEENQKWGIKVNTKKSKIMRVTKKNGPYQQVFSRGD